MTEQAYLDLLRDIMENGVVKTDRTGTGTKSVFGRQLRFDLSKGFPLITTKRVHFKSIVGELLWFLSGSTNIKPLVDQGINLWNNWPCKRFNQFIDSVDCTETEHELALEWAEGRVEDRDWRTIRPTVKEFAADIKQYEAFACIYGELGPVYGFQWRYWPEKKKPVYINNYEQLPAYSKGWIDQIVQSIEMLKNQPDSRRNIVSAWNVADIEQMAVSGLPPCHFAFQLNTRPMNDDERIKEYNENKHRYLDNFNKESGTFTSHDTLDPIINNKEKPLQAIVNLDLLRIPDKKLDLNCSIRSWDTFLGGPFNIASYALLIHLYARQVNMVPGELIISSGDTHIYSNHFDQVREQLSREPYDLPHLLLHDRPSIFDYKPEDIQLFNYQSKEAIKAPIAV